MTCNGLVMVGCHFAPESRLKNILLKLWIKKQRRMVISIFLLMLRYTCYIKFKIKLDRLSFHYKILIWIKRRFFTLYLPINEIQIQQAFGKLIYMYSPFTKGHIYCLIANFPNLCLISNKQVLENFHLI